MQTEESKQLESLARQIDALALAMKIGLCAMALVLGYFNARTAFSIDHFKGIYRDMLGGKPLPVSTQWVIILQTPLILLSLAVPLAAVGAIFLRRPVLAAIVIGGVFIIITVELVTVTTALFAPISTIISSMQGD